MGDGGTRTLGVRSRQEPRRTSTLAKIELQAVRTRGPVERQPSQGCSTSGRAGPTWHVGSQREDPLTRPAAKQGLTLPSTSADDQRMSLACTTTSCTALVANGAAP